MDWDGLWPSFLFLGGVMETGVVELMAVAEDAGNAAGGIKSLKPQRAERGREGREEKLAASAGYRVSRETGGLEEALGWD